MTAILIAYAPKQLKDVTKTKNVQNVYIHNSQKLETTQISIKLWIDIFIHRIVYPFIK